MFLSTGCTTVRHEFHGRDAGQVWTAMKAVAQSPDYDDWHVMTNDVWADPNEARLEIYRVVERSNRSTALGALRRWPERQEWRFRVVLEEADPPKARFISRGVDVPVRADQEGRRYFAAVRRLLYADMDALVPMTPADDRLQMPAPPETPARPAPDAAPPEPEPTPRMYDPDDLHEVDAPDVPEDDPPRRRDPGPDGLEEP